MAEGACVQHGVSRLCKPSGYTVSCMHILSPPAQKHVPHLLTLICTCWFKGYWIVHVLAEWARGRHTLQMRTLLLVKPIACAWVANSPPLLSLSWMPSMIMSTFFAFVNCWTLPPASPMLSLMSTFFHCYLSHLAEYPHHHHLYCSLWVKVISA